MAINMAINVKTKITRLFVASSMIAPAAAVFAHTDVATVISTTPVYQQVLMPQRQCWTEQIATYEERRVYQPEYVYESRSSGNGTGAILGAIVGGVIGHQFGHSSSGRDRSTAAGAVIGGLIGNDMERSSYRGYRRSGYVDVERIPVTRNVERCRTTNSYQEEITSYDVRYRYNGREYVTRLSYDPGPTLPINIEVRPADQGRAQVYPRTY